MLYAQGGNQGEEVPYIGASVVIFIILLLMNLLVRGNIFFSSIKLYANAKDIVNSEKH